jgi:UDP-2-acetamido-3-amino-2,3-dideoxy-glucuronate N-acetyltransferase
MIHPLSDVQSQCVGKNTHIWQYCVVLGGAVIGENSNICSHCFIENDVIIGDNVTIKNGVQIWDGMRIANDVFIGPNVTFCNDRYPKSRNTHWQLEPVIIEKAAVVGANATILPGVVIGAGAIIGAGVLFTKNVMPHTKILGCVTRPGNVNC